MKPGPQQQAEIFDLDRPNEYARWRDEKLNSAPRSAEDLLVEVNDISQPSPAETQEIARLNRVCNMAVYACHSACDDEQTYRQKAHAMAEHFGLHRFESHRSMSDDGLVAIEVVDTEGEGRKGFIPYTDRPISWHTDGYYKHTSKRIKAMVLHCVRPAREGGINQLYDPELAYIRLRDENPDYIRAFSHRRVMTIPAFYDDDGSVRPDCCGPVFTWDRYTGDLHMRFTDRKRNVVWRDDETTSEALEFLRHVLSTDELVITYQMKAGEGLICNNVLHNRSGFTDDTTPGKGRLYLRARYLDRVEA